MMEESLDVPVVGAVEMLTALAVAALVCIAVATLISGNFSVDISDVNLARFGGV